MPVGDGSALSFELADDPGDRDVLKSVGQAALETLSRRLRIACRWQAPDPGPAASGSARQGANGPAGSCHGVDTPDRTHPPRAAVRIPAEVLAHRVAYAADMVHQEVRPRPRERRLNPSGRSRTPKG